MDGPRDYYTKSVRQRKTSYVIIHMWNLKNMQINLFTEQKKQNHRLENELMVAKGERSGEEMDRSLGLSYIHYCIWNGWSLGICCTAQGTLCSVITYMRKESEKGYM